MLVFFNKGFNFVVSDELISDHSPILNFVAVPFSVKLSNPQIEKFKQSVLPILKKCASFFTCTLFLQSRYLCNFIKLFLLCLLNILNYLLICIFEFKIYCNVAVCMN